MAKKVSKTVVLNHIKKYLPKLKEKGMVRISPYIEGYETNDVENWITANKSEITSLRGVEKVVIENGDWSNTFFLLGKPCKEFDQLAKYLEKCACNKVLLSHNIYYDWVSGKRSRMDVTDRRMLCFDSKSCANVLTWLKENKAATKGTTVEIEFKSRLHCPDRYNLEGEDRECEWDGECFHGAEITIYTPSHRVRSKNQIYI